MKIRICIGILAAVFVGSIFPAIAQSTTTVVNSPTPGNRTVEHTAVAPNGKVSTTATTITKANGTRNVQTTHTGANGKTSTRDIVTTHDAQTGTEQKLVVNGPASATSVHHKHADNTTTVAAASQQ